MTTATSDGVSDGDGGRALPPPPKEGIPFAALPWNLNLPDEHSYLHLTTTPDEGWTLAHYDPETGRGAVSDSLKGYSSAPLPLFPSATSLNYGTTVWEGLACRRSPASGRALVFRPRLNWERFAAGARAMCLPAPSYELFMRGVQLAIRENAHLIPPAPEVDPDTGVPRGGAKLYVRPMLLGSGQQLGLHASPRVSLLFFVSPTGSYFQGKAAGGLKLHLERRRSRAARGGTGNVKCCGNYAVTMRPLLDAKEKGFHDNLYLELDTYHNPPPGATSRLQKAVLQELSAANIFLVLRTGEIVTPSLKRGTILPGVTRDTILTLASEFRDELRPILAESIEASGTGGGTRVDSVAVSERDVRVEDLSDAVEAFVTGTAAEVVPVASVGTSRTPPGELEEWGGREESLLVEFPHGAAGPGPVTGKLLDMLREVLAEGRKCERTEDWLCDVYATPEGFRKGGV